MLFLQFEIIYLHYFLSSLPHVSSRYCFFSVCSLEHLVTSLKSSTQQTNTNTHFIVNANKNSLPSEFLQPQQHQLQIQINGADKNSTKRLSENVTATANNQTIGKLSPPKTAKASQVHLSSANGPVTDL